MLRFFCGSFKCTVTFQTFLVIQVEKSFERIIIRRSVDSQRCDYLSLLSGGLGGLTTATSAAPGGLFGAMAVPAAAAPTVKRGLGGVDPKAILAAPTLAAGGKSA